MAGLVPAGTSQFVIPAKAGKPIKFLSPRRKSGGGFTFEVQQLLAEDLCRGFVAETFARRIVVGLQHCIEVLILESCKIGLSRQEAAHAPDGVFDGAFLPWCVGIAEEGLDAGAVKLAVVCELGSVVEGDGFAETVRQWFEKGSESFDGRRCGPVRWPRCKQYA